MKKVLKILGYFVGAALLGIGVLVTTCALKWPPSFPDTPKPAITASQDPEVIARGKYLFEAVAHCGSCHQPMNDYLAVKPGDTQVPKGGHEWHMGPLGVIRSANITSHETTGIGKWTDGELARAIRHGVGKDGEPLLFMFAVGQSSDEDLTAIISYLRTIPAVDSKIEDSEYGLLGKVLFQGPMAFFAKPHDYSKLAPPFVKEGSASVERGRYLAEGPAFCSGCHSDFSFENDEIAFVGQVNSGNLGNPFPDETESGMAFYAPNLTPDPNTGLITSWTQEQFMTRMKGGRVYKGSPMPWESYANMTDADIESIWMYLRALPPTDKNVGVPRRKEGEKP
jgi:mono/diheme cytochrome c family protein